MDSRDPKWYHLIGVALACAWVSQLYLAYLHVSEFGAFAGVCLGLMVLVYARTAARTRDLGWLYGWGEEALISMWVRGMLISLTFFAPAVRRGLVRFFPERIGGEGVVGSTVGTSLGLGALVAFWLLMHNPRPVPRSPKA